ncbi:hypothetical protein ACFL9T_16900 [Thermodesulfobacteriota bacterium]
MMLVIISDLHFTDGTTSNWSKGQDLFNISPKAFKLFVSKISNIVERRKNIEKVTFIYNGDIFDLLRTEAWFEISADSHPWSIPLKKEIVYERCKDILENTMNHKQNRESLAWLNGTHDDFQDVWKVGADIDRVYIPGNHDRIINLSQPCRSLVYKNLLQETGSSIFNNFYKDQDFHKALVMHGHESDAYNCELNKKGRPIYKDIPIGDPMTTMLFSRLGYEANQLNIPKEAKRRFREIDNVRPTLATVRYVKDLIKEFKIEKKVKEILNEIVKDFENIEYVDKWLSEHDKWNFRYDEADKLQVALRAIKLLGTSLPSGLLEKLADLVRDESCQKYALRQLRSDLGRDFLYCVFGHTHEHIHIPLYIENGVERHYLNSGTFRTTFSQTYDESVFTRFQRMSFVIIYGPKEYDHNEDNPIYESWSGLRMHH